MEEERAQIKLTMLSTEIAMDPALVRLGSALLSLSL